MSVFDGQRRPSGRNHQPSKQEQALVPPPSPEQDDDELTCEAQDWNLLLQLKEAKSTAERCKILTIHLESLKRTKEDFHEFSQHFPKLLAEIFGLVSVSSSTRASSAGTQTTSPGTKGWIFLSKDLNQSEDFKAVITLLSPDGPICQLTLHHQDKQNLAYAFPLSLLPWSIRHRIEAGDPPALYKERLSTNKEDLLLNMFEYFIFIFFYCPVFQRNPLGDRNASHDNLPSHFSSFSSSSSSSSSSSTSASSTSLLRSSSSKSDRNFSASALFPELVRRYCAHFLLSHRFQSLFLRLIRDFWLGQNALPSSQGIYDRMSRNNTVPTEYIPPTPSLILALQKVCSFLVAPDTGSGSLASSSSSSSSLSSIANDLQLHERCVAELRPDLLNFFRLKLQNWDVRIDAATSFMVVDAWLRYIGPWKHVGKNNKNNSPDAWRSHIESNFNFYSPLLAQFLQGATNLNYANADDCNRLIQVLAVFESPVLHNDVLPKCERLFLRAMMQYSGNHHSWGINDSQLDQSQLETTVQLDQLDQWQETGGSATLDFEPLFFVPRENHSIAIYRTIRTLADSLSTELMKLKAKEKDEEEKFQRQSLWHRMMSYRPVKDTTKLQKALKRASEQLKKIFPHVLPNKQSPSSDPRLKDDDVFARKDEGYKKLYERQMNMRFEGPAELLPPRSDELACLVKLARKASSLLKSKTGLDVNLRQFASIIFLVQLSICLVVLWLLYRFIFFLFFR